MDKLLSIVVPIYNVSEYLDRCVSSIVSQNYKNAEIILVDDGSPDDCGQMCDRWKEKDIRIRVIHKENGGLSDARNAGIDIAAGEYIAFVDGDDSVEPDMYTTMIREMEDGDAAVACCGKRKIYRDGTIEEVQCGEPAVMSAEEAIGCMLVGAKIDEQACDKVYKRALFDDIRFPKGELNEDLPVIPLLFSKSGKVVHVGQAYYNYYQNTGSITRSGYNEKKHIYIEHLKKAREYIETNYPGLNNTLTVLDARYSYSMLFCIYSDPKAKKRFRDDFRWYRKCFSNAYPACLKYGSFPGKHRIVFACMYLRLGGLLALVNKILKRIGK